MAQNNHPQFFCLAQLIQLRNKAFSLLFFGYNYEWQKDDEGNAVQVEIPKTKIIYKEEDIDFKPPKKVTELERKLEKKLTIQKGDDNGQ